MDLKPANVVLLEKLVGELHGKPVFCGHDPASIAIVDLILEGLIIRCDRHGHPTKASNLVFHLPCAKGSVRGLIRQFEPDAQS